MALRVGEHTMVERDSERRERPRRKALFVAVEHEGDDIYYRVITDVSEGGFAFEEPAVPRRVGDAVIMDFPQLGRAPLRVRGEIASAQRARVGVRFTEPPLELTRLIAELPRR